VVVRGETAGRILEAPEGQGGFGYDPWFWSAELGCSFGQASLTAKNGVSHRARAFAALFAALQARGVVDGGAGAG
jgi:XTP/dITP diphosphohydrolase